MSPVIIGGNDWAAAWAVDANGEPMVDVPGGDRQREMAIRFGINVVMYALTGNYKTDQVHVPALLGAAGQMNYAHRFRAACAARIACGRWSAIAAALTICVFPACARAAHGRAGLAFAVLLAALANPLIVHETREPLPDVAAIIVDHSQSMDIGNAPRRRRCRARTGSTRNLPADKSLEVREATVTTRRGEDNGTQLFAALDSALADVPPERIAGAIVITDGEVHDAPPADKLSMHAPLHALIAGKQDERDRKLTIVSAARFAIVGQDADIALRVDDFGAARKRLRRRRRAHRRRRRSGTKSCRSARTRPSRSRSPMAARTSSSLRRKPGPAELTLQNNRAVVTVSGVRDRLRVLLVSGEPHAGERVWRNLLKADPSVDLVHFTILRPPDKQDATPIDELSLIAFPTRELFVEKLDQFDLVIFDRYQRARHPAARLFREYRALCARMAARCWCPPGPEFAQPNRASIARRWPRCCRRSRPATSSRKASSRW